MRPQQVEEDAAAEMAKVVEADDGLGVLGSEAVELCFVPEELLALVGQVMQRPRHLAADPGEGVAAIGSGHRGGLPPEVEDALRREGPGAEVGLAGGVELEL